MNADMTTAAQDRAQQIRDGLATVWNLLLDAYAAEDWKELGYPSWDAYCSEELQGRTPRLAKSERGGVVQELAEHGMPIKAIAAATGIARNTVRADLRAAEEQTAGGHFDPAPVKGATERPATYRKPSTVLRDAGVIDMATGEVYDPDTITPENREAIQAERDRMLGLYTDASVFSQALNRLASLSDPRRVAHYLEVARTARNRPDFNMKHHNPESIRNIAQHLINYADALEAQS